MQGQDQSELETEPAEQAQDDGASIEPIATHDVAHETYETRGAREVDWLALGIVVLVGGLFALAGRFSSQPATSLVPVAVLSATGCGLLVTALRKLHTFERPGLREAAVGGLFIALFQFLAAISYPNVVYALGQAADERLGFLSTWGLIGAFTILFSMVGALLGHMTFGQLRTRTARTNSGNVVPISEVEEEHLTATQDVQKSTLSETEADNENADNDEKEQGKDDREDAQSDEPVPPAQMVIPQRSLISYGISVILLGLAPTMVGYVFAAAYDYLLQVNLFFPGPYPTIRLLSTLLPWQVPIPFSLNSSDPNTVIFLLWQLWRIPLFLGNPVMFDIQSLEPLLFNGAALGLLLWWVPVADRQHQDGLLRWPVFLCLQLLLGLFLVLPADLLIIRGLQGLLQDQLVAVPIRTLHILDQSTFLLNLVTGPMICLAIGGLLLFLSPKKGGRIAKTAPVV